jgi:DUF1680 family protein
MNIRLLFLSLVGMAFTTLTTLAQSYVPERNDAKMKIKPVIDIKAFNFPLSAVRLLESPFKTAMEADAKYLLSVEPDRLLSGFREHSGLQAKGKIYGGWESSGLAGHSLGHYLSACAMEYASTGNAEFLKRVNYIVDELDECQRARKTGYVGAIPKEDTLWREVAAGDIRSKGFDLNGAWSPWYTVHKVMGGLLDAYLYCNNTKALKIETAMADWTGNTIKNLNEDQMQKMLFCEYGGMNETLVNTYAMTGNKKYLDLSYRFYDKRILDSLAVKQDVLPGKHSNTQIPKIIGSARRYELTGDKRDQTIADYFWDIVIKDHTYATGGNSNYEYFGAAGKLNDQLTENTTETCNTYNMLKLTRHLFSINPSASLMDYYEKGLYNHILASQDHDNGMMTYFVPLRMGGRKRFSSPFTTFTCCVGSGMENHVKYGESIYFRGKDGSLYVNLFIPSVLTWKENGVTLKQETSIPADNQTVFTVTAAKASKFALRIRKPHWAKTMDVIVNGKPQNAVLENGYFVVTRTWNNNDKVVCNLPSDFYTEAMPDNPDRRAVFYGPVLLAGTLGKKEPDPVRGTPVFVTNAVQTSDWVKPVNLTDLTFKTQNTGNPSDVELVPFSTIQDDYYSVYFDVFSTDKWASQQKIYEAAKQKEQELEARTVDVLRMGEMQPERDHEFSGEKTMTGENHGKKFRASRGGSDMSFKMKIKPEAQNALICTYWGMDNRGKIFDVLVDGVKIATEDLNKYKESRFYDISYPIPAELIKDKQTVTITLKPQPDNSVGPVYGSRVITK